MSGGSKAKLWSLGVLGSLALSYLGLCAYLFAEQRQLVFEPGATPLRDPPAGSGYDSLDIAVPDLGTLKDWWIPPESRRMPTVVFFHGNASDRTEFMSQGLLLHRRGWGVVLASYPGYSGNPGKPTESSFMADARATLATLTPRVGPIIVWGHSLGSGVAARMASEARAAGLVLEAPYTSLVDVAALRYPYVPVRWLLLDRFDTQSLLERIQVPVLIIHSVDDRTIPYAMGRELAARLGERANFVPMSGLGHYPHHQDLTDIVVHWAQTRGIAE